MSKIDFGHLSNLCDQISEMEARIRDAAQAEFKPALKDAINVLREYVPQLAQFRWQQYIPGFNDGDACEFTLCEVTFKFRDIESGGAEDNGFYEPNFNRNRMDEKDYSWGLYPLVRDNTITADQAEILVNLSNTISGLETACELAFGPDSEITVDIDSGELTVEEYDCGY